MTPAAWPLPVQLTGSRWGRWVLRLAGWRVEFAGLPTRQGVAVVYPHTSNWDFIVLILAKWAIGISVGFWGKASLFRMPLFGRWLRWLGGMPVQRTAAQGAVGQMVAYMQAMKAAGDWYWLALAPEGTRKRIPGWRSGFYQVAHRADVPLLLVRLDYATRTVRVTDFVRLSGDAATDMAHIASVYAGVHGKRPEGASPIVLLDASVPRERTVVT